MCGIAGIVSLNQQPIPYLSEKLAVMDELLEHRGPDDAGTWCNANGSVGLVHRRLSIIDLTAEAHQPMLGSNGAALTFNGEIYNYIELQHKFAGKWDFHSHSDTETILAAYQEYGRDCVDHLRGMFAFAIWDGEQLFCARDRFGIKPFYYAVVDDCFVFASEAKAILPFLHEIKTHQEAFSEYMTFQFPIGEDTMFNGIKQLMPAHALTLKNTKVETWRYWDVCYDMDTEHPEEYFNHQLKELFDDSISHHLRSDVPVGCYLSGGIDSSLISVLAAKHKASRLPLFNGRFTEYAGYDESHYAQIVAKDVGELFISEMSANNFIDTLPKLIYHMDYPVAGPGAFPQYMVSKLARQHVKVVLGGQGGDEIFGGYARYVIGYFDQCMKAAVEGNYDPSTFPVSIESMMPNLQMLQEYKPLMKMFWQDGAFDTLDKRYFRLIDRTADIHDELYEGAINRDYVFSKFTDIFNNTSNFKTESYFDRMTHFDLKCLLPGLLHVEDRVSMAHGLEARVPFLDHPLIEFAARIPPNIKYKDGKMKQMLTQSFADCIPDPILNRRDKMGFPVPLSEWAQKECKDFFISTFESGAAKNREFVNYKNVLANLKHTGRFSRKLWAFLCYELWMQQFHDNAKFKRLSR